MEYPRTFQAFPGCSFSGRQPRGLGACGGQGRASGLMRRIKKQTQETGWEFGTTGIGGGGGSWARPWYLSPYPLIYGNVWLFGTALLFEILVSIPPAKAALFFCLFILLPHWEVTDALGDATWGFYWRFYVLFLSVVLVYEYGVVVSLGSRWKRIGGRNG